ncbi:hypothetical protein [Priestia koreensis]|uniref:hypothetical protein n=1 Tax=Priestia koreensis TaxID=284581 RepID=UPI0028F7006A|nr:hypothetical protein [Priestia koreensis]
MDFLYCKAKKQPSSFQNGNLAITSDAVALGCLERKVRDSYGISVTGETRQSSEEAHCKPRGKRSGLEWKSTDSVMNAIL